MSVKIKVSYQTNQELHQVLALLNPVIKSWRKTNDKPGHFRKVYIDLK